MSISKVFLSLTVAVLLVCTAGFKFIEVEKEIIAEKVQWMSFEEAVAKNKLEPKKIFVDVYTDWCGWCKKMDAGTFNNPVVAKYLNEKYYNVKLDAEGQGSY